MCREVVPVLLKPMQKIFLDFDQSLSINKISHKEGHECNSEVNLSFDDIYYKQVAYENQKDFGQSKCNVRLAYVGTRENLMNYNHA